MEGRSLCTPGNLKVDNEQSEKRKIIIENLQILKDNTILETNATDANKKNTNNSKPRRNGPNMKDALTLDFEENYDCETGLEDGIGCNVLNSQNGNLDVHPSTYPNGCPKNYFIMLNKTNTQS